MKQVGHQGSSGLSRDAQDAALDHSSPLGGAECQWAPHTLSQQERRHLTAQLGSLCPAAAGLALKHLISQPDPPGFLPPP